MRPHLPVLPDEAQVARFVELNSLEHEKGIDFSMDRGLFLSFPENVGPKTLEGQVSSLHIEKLVGSPEESSSAQPLKWSYGLTGMRFGTSNLRSRSGLGYFRFSKR